MEQDNLTQVIERLETLRSLLTISYDHAESLPPEVGGVLDDIDHLIEEISTFKPTLQ